MSKAFLPLGILAAAGVMGSLAGGQGSPARRRAKIHPVTGLERRGEFHYFKLGAKAYREGAARKDNPFKGWQAKWWDKGWAGVRPRRQRGRAARGRRARKSAFERNVEGVWESDADQRARIRAGLNWISLRHGRHSPWETQHSADIPGGHISYGKFGKTISVWMHRNKKDYALVKSRGGYEFSRVTSTSKSRSSMIWSYPAYGPYDGSATFRTGSDARKAIVAALAANPRVGEAARGRRAVEAGQKFVIVDTLVPGGRWVDQIIYDSSAEADRAAAHYATQGDVRRGHVQVIDAVWYAPAEARLRTTGMRGQKGRRAAPTLKQRKAMGQKLQALPWSQASALYRRNHPQYEGIGGYPMNTKLRASGARSYGVAAYNAGKLTKKDVEIIFRRTSRRYPSMPKFDAMVCKTRKNGKHRNCKSVTSR